MKEIVKRELERSPNNVNTIDVQSRVRKACNNINKDEIGRLINYISNLYLSKKNQDLTLFLSLSLNLDLSFLKNFYDN